MFAYTPNPRRNLNAQPWSLCVPPDAAYAGDPALPPPCGSSSEPLAGGSTQASLPPAVSGVSGTVPATGCLAQQKGREDFHSALKGAPRMLLAYSRISHPEQTPNLACTENTYVAASCSTGQPHQYVHGGAYRLFCGGGATVFAPILFPTEVFPEQHAGHDAHR